MKNHLAASAIASAIIAAIISICFAIFSSYGLSVIAGIFSFSFLIIVAANIQPEHLSVNSVAAEITDRELHEQLLTELRKSNSKKSFLQ